MTTGQQVKRMTAGDVMLDDYFNAIDQGLGLWLETERDLRPRENRYAALCAGSLQALTVALNVMRFFSCRRRLVTVRVTTPMLADVPHGALRLPQVFYRWEARIGPEAPNPLYGAPKIGELTFAVRPTITRGERGERFINVEVAVRRRKGGVLEIVPFDVDEVVSITHPLRPNDPGQLAVAAKQVVRLAERKDSRLARILKAVFEQFEVEITDMFLWFRRRREASQRMYTLYLAHETGVEEVLLAKVPGGGVALVLRPPDDPEIDVEERTGADEARAIVEDIVSSTSEEEEAATQDLFALLDSWPTEDRAAVLRKEYSRLQTEAERRMMAAVAELSSLGAVDAGWLERVRDEAHATMGEVLFGPQSHDASLELSRRHVHAGAETTVLDEWRVKRDALDETGSQAQRDTSEMMREIVNALPHFSGMKLLHIGLRERLLLLERVLDVYRNHIAPS